jgi:hypothetical protein
MYTGACHHDILMEARRTTNGIPVVGKHVCWCITRRAYVLLAGKGGNDDIVKQHTLLYTTYVAL